MKPPKPPSNQPPQNQPPNQPSPPAKSDGKGSGYSGYGTYGDYGAYGYGTGYGNYGGYGAGGSGAPGGPGGQGGYGPGGYGGYYYGYGYGYGGNPAGGEPAQSRSIRDYLIILRERIWYLLLTFFVIFGAFVLYLVNTTPEYVATASLRVYKSVDTPMDSGLKDPTDEVVGPEEFNTRIRLMETRDIAVAVAGRMSDEEKAAFLAPFRTNNALVPEMNLVDRLMSRRQVTPGRMAYILQVGVEHPTPDLAAKVANYFAEEFINYNSRLNVEKAMKAVEELKQQSKEQGEKVDQIEAQKNAMVDKYGTLNLDPKNNVMPAQLQAYNAAVTAAQGELDLCEVRWKQCQDFLASHQPLWNLSFIAADKEVSDTRTAIDNLNTEISGLEQTFGERHPEIVKRNEQIDTLKKQLSDAVDNVVKTVKSEYDAAQDRFNRASQELDNLQKENHELSLAQENFDQLQTEKDSAEAMLQQLDKTIEEQQSKIILGGESYQKIDDASSSIVQSEPKAVLLISAGLVTGAMAGIGMAFLVAFLDDRIKSAFDIESYVGLPLIGILPRIAHLNANEKAQAVASNADRRITEAFRSLYSALKLNDASKNARVILVTSTVPSEGKSFLTTNLALTYAMHAERVLLIDCDLRMPNIAKSLGRETGEHGLMTHLQEGRAFEECIVKDFYPGLDVMPTGGRTNNPTQIFNSREFADFIARMRQQYDRVFIDSPPLGAVSDSLNLLPNVDGVLYVIKFNTVKRKVAKINLARLMQGNVPIFGAILNQISLASASYYYTHYYDKSYRNYYMREDENEAQAQGEATPQAPADASESTPEQK
jgi:capsular exopolysaccharide synthesis family protein